MDLSLKISIKKGDSDLKAEFGTSSHKLWQCSSGSVVTLNRYRDSGRDELSFLGTEPGNNGTSDLGFGCIWAGKWARWRDKADESSRRHCYRPGCQSLHGFVDSNFILIWNYAENTHYKSGNKSRLEQCPGQRQREPGSLVSFQTYKSS